MRSQREKIKNKKQNFPGEQFIFRVVLCIYILKNLILYSSVCEYWIFYKLWRNWFRRRDFLFRRIYKNRYLIMKSSNQSLIQKVSGIPNEERSKNHYLLASFKFHFLNVYLKAMISILIGHRFNVTLCQFKVCCLNIFIKMFLAENSASNIYITPRSVFHQFHEIICSFHG